MFLVDFVSLVSGNGTYYKYSSYSLILGIVSINVLLLSKLTLLETVKKRIKKKINVKTTIVPIELSYSTV